jgi:hypothetical protein
MLVEQGKIPLFSCCYRTEIVYIININCCHSFCQERRGGKAPGQVKSGEIPPVEAGDSSGNNTPKETPKGQPKDEPFKWRNQAAA